MPTRYEPISDWSHTGRASIVESRGAEIRLLLDTAFTEFCDQHELSSFGFRGDDPVAEAVEWCVTQFIKRDLDPGRLHPDSRSFRLFTEVGFWLAQKVGAPAFARLRHLRHAGLTPPEATGAWEPSQDESPTRALERLKGRLAHTLRELRHRTCADLVGYWLRGTQRLRTQLLGWSGEGAIENLASSKTRISAHVHDARFRFQCLHRGLVQDAAVDPGLAAARETLFRSCENEVPYRRSARQAAEALPEGAVRGPREVRRLCREGTATLLQTLTGQLAAIPENEEARAEWIFGRQAVAPMTLSALDLDDREDLRLQLQKLPTLEVLLQEESG